MTPRQQAFCNEYVKSQNGTQAAIKAGYSEKAAPVMACRNLQKRQIREAIARKRAKIKEKLPITREYVIEGLLYESQREDSTPHARIAALKALHHCLVIEEKLEDLEAEKEEKIEKAAIEEAEEKEKELKAVKEKAKKEAEMLQNQNGKNTGQGEEILQKAV